MRAPEKDAKGGTEAKQPTAYRGRLPGEGDVSGRPLTPTLIIFSGEASHQKPPDFTQQQESCNVCNAVGAGHQWLKGMLPGHTFAVSALRWGLHPDRTGMRPAQGFDCFSPCQILLLPSVCILHRTPTEALHRAEALFKNVLAQFILPLLTFIHDPF